jgi:peptide/nickel transport system substrate-binding protein
VLQVVASNSGTSEAVARIVVGALNELGFKTHVTYVDQSVMYSKYCGVPAQEIDVCPSVGWQRDFADPQTVLYLAFWGPGIMPSGNSNWSQVNEAAINDAMDTAVVASGSARVRAWAAIDRALVQQAVAVPEEFDTQPYIEGSGVAGVNDVWDSGAWDYDFTSLK